MANTQSSELVTFGKKYNGLPVEVMLEDRNYTDWLANQAWFKAQHPKLYTIIINNGAPEETPEHNIFQAKFLNKALLMMLFQRLAGIPAYLPETPQFEVDGWDVVAPMKYRDGVYQSDKYLRIELKPTLGDDFPAVLRQVKRNAEPRYEGVGHWRQQKGPDRTDCFDVVVCESFTATTVTFDQVVEMFRTSGIFLLLTSEIAAPDWHTRLAVANVKFNPVTQLFKIPDQAVDAEFLALIKENRNLISAELSSRLSFWIDRMLEDAKTTKELEELKILFQEKNWAPAAISIMERAYLIASDGIAKKNAAVVAKKWERRKREIEDNTPILKGYYQQWIYFEPAENGQLRLFHRFCLMDAEEAAIREKSAAILSELSLLTTEELKRVYPAVSCGSGVLI